MKRLVKYDSIYKENTSLLEIEIDILYLDESSQISASTILDLKDSSFFDFESNVMLACEVRDYELEDSYQSSVEGSVSQYYIYTKTNEDGTKLRVFLKIRVSDHLAPDRTFHGRRISQKELSTNYVKEQSKKYAESNFNQKRGYRPRLIDIVFDDEHYTSYEKALRDIEDRLDEFDLD